MSRCTVASAIGSLVTGCSITKLEMATGIGRPPRWLRSVDSPSQCPWATTAGCSISSEALMPSSVR